MQKLYGYIAKQTAIVTYSPDTSVENNYRMWYARELKIYRGIENTIQIQFNNLDQKPVNVSGKKFYFTVLQRENFTRIINKLGTIESTSNSRVNFVFNDSDLRDVNSTMYKYSIHELKSDGTKEVVYTSDDFNASGDILIIDGAYNSFIPSAELDFVKDNDLSRTVVLDDDTEIENDADILTEDDDLELITITSSINARADSNKNSGLHTVQYNLENFKGDIVVEGSLDPVSNLNPVNWTEITKETYTESTTGNQYINFNGIYNAVRFKQVRTLGTHLTKVLYRH